ncbi:hypothetical protein NMY22_g14577 [Coprinellus aureogranulatus]|nr:hypothetical protein NMY22_g14577 [Coprinellus aureogranulatus]
MARSSSSLPPSSPTLASESSRATRETSPTSDNIEELRDMAAKYKRMMDAESAKRKRKDGRTPSYITMGRGIPRLIDPFTSLSELVVMADQHEAHVKEPKELPYVADDDEDEELRLYVTQEKARLLRDNKRASESLRLVPSVITNFKRVINGDSEVVNEMYSATSRGYSNAQSDDISKLKTAVGNWLNEWSDPSISHIPLKTTSREGRGLQHDLCGKLLCPIDINWNDLEVREKVRSCEPGHELSMFARALYAGYTGDPAKLQEGYLRSMLLVKVYRHIFTSPSSAQDIDALAENDENAAPPKKKSRTSKGRCVVQLNMMSRVTPRSIAYAAVQLLFALSNAAQWCEESEGLVYRDVYYEIVDFLSPEDDDTKKLVRELLDWWNKQVFPGASHSRISSKSAPSGRDRLAQQRAALQAQCPEDFVPTTEAERDLLCKHLFWRAVSSFGFTLWTRNFETTNFRYGNIDFLGSKRPRYSSNPVEQPPFLRLSLRERKCWQKKMKNGELQMNGHVYNIYPLPTSTSTPSIDLYKHLLNWLDFAETYLLGRPWHPNDYVFPKISKRIHPDTPMSPGAMGKLIHETATAAGIPNADLFTTHCFRRGGAQYRLSANGVTPSYGDTDISPSGSHAGEALDTQPLTVAEGKRLMGDFTRHVVNHLEGSLKSQILSLQNSVADLAFYPSHSPSRFTFTPATQIAGYPPHHPQWLRRQHHRFASSSTHTSGLSKLGIGHRTHTSLGDHIQRSRVLARTFNSLTPTFPPLFPTTINVHTCLPIYTCSTLQHVHPRAQ